MQPKTILVCLTTPDNAATLLKAAVPLARRFNAHLIGLHTIEALVVYPGIAMHVPAPAFVAFNDSQKEQSAQIKAVFERYTQSETFQAEFRLIRAEAVSANDRMIECARAADLVIMSQEDKVTDRYDQRHAQVEVIRQSGRPVIVVPLGYDGPEIGRKILLGWSATREAARAAHDMMDIAAAGADVTALRVGDGPKDSLRDADAIDIVETLARHELEATLQRREPAGKHVAEVLNEVALEKDADLIATGAFGHSRVYDFVLGATTYDLLKDAKRPVLFSK